MEPQKEISQQALSYQKEVGDGSSSNAVSLQVKPWEPGRLNARHWNIIRLHLLGMRNTEIARHPTVRMTEPRVSMVLNSQLAKAEIRRIQQALNGRVEDVTEALSQDAAAVYELMRQRLFSGELADKDLIRLGFGLLDRAGHAPVRVTVAAPSGMSTEELQEIQKRARKLGVRTFSEEEEVEVEEAQIVNEDSDEAPES